MDAGVSAKADYKLHLGDCLDFMRTLAPGSIDAVVTDPPYSSGGAFRGDRMNSTSIKYVDNRDTLDRPDFTGDNRDQHAYNYWCTLWLTECLRITKPAGVALLFTDWRQLPTTTDAIQSGGWIWRGIVPWDKTEAARPARGRFRNQCEYVVWGSNGPMVDEGECLPGMFRMSVASDEKFHIAGKPPRLMAGLLAIVPAGGVVFDPFSGSGTTTGVACMKLGLHFIGCEISESYYAIAEKRIREAASQMILPFEA